MAKKRIFAAELLNDIAVKMATTPSRTIRPATTADIPDIMPVFDEARQKIHYQQITIRLKS